MQVPKLHKMNIFFISDLHLGHANIINFDGPYGGKLRDFDTLDAHDDAVIDRINAVVKPTDRLIIVGDCVINKRHMHKVGRINGRKTLVMGNHDPMSFEFLTPYFEKIAGALEVSDFIVTHIPVHPNQVGVGSRFRANIHGHLHGVYVRTEDGLFMDHRYYNVSVECLNYTPISLEQIKVRYT